MFAPLRPRAQLGSVLLGLFLALVFLPACGRPEPEEHATVIAERRLHQAEGWEYVTTVGVPRETVEARFIRHLDAAGRLHVIAPGIDLPGSAQLEDVERVFQEDGYVFREVKIMVDPASGYSIVFRKRR